MIFENWNARTLVAVVSGEQHGICIHQPSSQHLSLSHLLLPVHVLPEFRWGTLLEAGPQSLQRAFGGNTVFSLTQVREEKVIPSSDNLVGFIKDTSVAIQSGLQPGCPQCHAVPTEAQLHKLVFSLISLWDRSTVVFMPCLCWQQMCSPEGTWESREACRWTDWSLSFNLALPGLCGLRQSSYPLWVLWPLSIKWEGEREPSNLTVGRRCSYNWHSAHC